MGHVKTDAVQCGDLCALVGLDKFEIGDTICDYENPEALPPIKIDEPTMSMLFTINNSPFFGKEGKFCTSRQIDERLQKELQKNLALQVRKTDGFDSWVVSGRGVLHLSVLIETMRREGYELQVGQPQVIYKEIDGVKCEPIEELTISTPEDYSSKLIDMVTRRKGDGFHADTGRQTEHSIQYSFARYYRFTNECYDCQSGRSHPCASFQRLPTIQGRY